jgi:hypothetical protein
VRDLIACRYSGVAMTVTGANAMRDVVAALPSAASVVLAGPIHRFIESDEQRLARTLANLGFDVTFLPTA